MIEYIAKDIAEFTNAMVQITRFYRDSRPWWRGQSDYSWGLIPSLHRKGFTSKESNINNRFRMMAKPRHANCPKSNDVFSWLFLMQHYHLPTRLLDWSESALVALYFATESDGNDNTDATIWAFLPTILNLQQLKREAICTPGSRDIHKLSLEAFVPNTTNPDCRIISVQTEQSDLRHMIQQSVFTIHGCSTPINELVDAEKFLAKIRIPGKAKTSFRQVLALFGISRSSLFPDLENLAMDLASLDFVLRAEPVNSADPKDRAAD